MKVQEGHSCTSEDPRDWDSDGAVCIDFLQRQESLNVVECLSVPQALGIVIIVYPVFHPIMDRDFLAKYSRVASIARAIGSCRTGPPANRKVLKTFNKIYFTIGW